VELRVYVDPNQENGVVAVKAALDASGATSIRAEVLNGRDWLAAYRLETKPFAVGRRWWLDPHPDAPTAAPEGRFRLVMEPRMAFGSGSHESTQLVLLELEQMLVGGCSVIDVGCGSGILSLACISLGAEWVLGVDVDPHSVWVARQTARQQEVEVEPSFMVGSVDCLDGFAFDVVLCNMISDHFLPMLEKLRALLSVGGIAVFSGILHAESRAIASALKKTGFEVVGQRKLEEWVSMRVVGA